MKKVAIVASLAALLVGITVPRGHTRAPDSRADKVGDFMRAKLTHAQHVFEGLLLEDYDKLVDQSQRISLMSLDASWQVLQTPTYAEQSAEFRRIVDRLTQAGKQKNIDGAVLVYVEMTLKCVNCHKYVRARRDARPEHGHRPEAGDQSPE